MQSTDCLFPECGRRVKAGGLCTGHYRQKSLGQELAPLQKHERRGPGPCAFVDCDRPRESKGLCKSHARQQREGRPLTSLVRVERSCAYAGCERPVVAGGLCNGHDHQRRRGAPLGPIRQTTSRSATLQERLDARTIKGDEDECWLWDGAKTDYGHGRMRDPEHERPRLTHVIAYELTYGPVPEGMEVDHKCRVPSCVNPAHLHAVSKQMNGENRKGANKNNRSSGVRNVSWQQGAWVPMIHPDGKVVYGGRFQSLVEAELRAIELRREHYGNSLTDVPTVTVDVLASEFVPDEPKKVCSIEGCGAPHRAKGLCKRHYTRQHEGKPMEPPRRVPKVCSESGCVKPAKSRGMCGMHYERWRKQRPAA